jgi:hypothetical protein
MSKLDHMGDCSKLSFPLLEFPGHYSLGGWLNCPISAAVARSLYLLVRFITYVYQILCLMFSSVLTGVFILASTTARSSNALLGWNCAYSFVSNVMYGVLYALSPEVFPTKDRGTGNALVASANRIFGVMVMAYHASQNET